MSQKASQADSFLVTIAPFRAMERIRSAFKARVRQGLIVLAMLAWGESENVGPKLHVITVEGCDVPNARVGVFVARPMDLSLASQKSSTSQRIPFSRPFDLIVASPDVAFGGRELCILATFQLKFA